MHSKIYKFALLLIAVLVLGCTTWAQSIDVTAVSSSLVPATHTLTITFKGAIGPILSGSDPLGLNGLHGTVTIMASESLSPKKHTATSATYILPAGAITVKAGINQFTTNSPSKMIINLTSTADTVAIIAAGPSGLMVTETTFLKTGSWTNAVLMHPTVFKPSPQKLTASTSANGPGCKVKYTIAGSTTVLGFKGTGSNSATADPVLPEDDLDQ